MVNVAANQDDFGRVPVLPSHVRGLAAFALLTIGLIGIFHEAALSMASQWIGSSAYHHGVIIAPISAWLIARREDWRRMKPAADWAGIPFIMAASVIWFVGRAASVDLLAHISLVLTIIGAVISVFGRELAARWSFALLLLFFMVPFGEEATPLLQRLASIAVAAALNLTGLETTRDGFLLTTSAGRFEMAASCAGLRFLLASALISTVVAALAFADWRKRAAFIVTALFLAILANWLRAYLIVLVATITDRRIGVGPEHVALGWAFYSLLIIALIGAARHFADYYAAPGSFIVSTGRAPASPAIVAVTAIMIAVSAVAYDRIIVSARGPLQPPATFPTLGVAGFLPSSTAPIFGASSGGGADLVRITRYTSNRSAAEITLAAAYFVEDRSGAEIANVSMIALANDDWRRIAIRTVKIPIEGVTMPVRMETLENSIGRKMEVAKVYWLGDRYYASPARLKIAIAAAKFAGRRRDGGVFFVAASHESNADPVAAINLFLANAQSIAEWRSTFSSSR